MPIKTHKLSKRIQEKPLIGGTRKGVPAYRVPAIEIGSKIKAKAKAGIMMGDINGLWPIHQMSAIRLLVGAFTKLLLPSLKKQ